MSTTGVNGWFSAIHAKPVGIESVWYEGAGEERQHHQEHRGVAGGLDTAGGQAERDAEPRESDREQQQDTTGADPADDAGARAVAEQHRDRRDDQQREAVCTKAART